MYEKEFIINKNTRLTKIEKCKSHIMSLYELLKKRKNNSNISHVKLPSLNEHIRFVNSRPYRTWFLIEKNEVLEGSVYINNVNVISIHLLRNNITLYEEILLFLIKNFKPLPAIPSKRNANFTVNLSPKNKLYAKLIVGKGAKKIQETYTLEKL